MLLDIRLRLEYGLLLAVAALVRAMPLSVATAFSAAVWRFIAPRTRRHRRAMKNLEMAMPEKAHAEREAIALAMWDNLGRVMAETLLMDRLLKDPSLIEVETPEVVERCLNNAGASIFASLHMGNWEICILPALAPNSSMAGVYRIVENPYVDRYIRKKRSLVWPSGMFASKSDEGMQTTMRIIAHLRSGGSIGLLSDLLDWKGVPVTFFGHTTVATAAPAWLARRTGARLWIGRCIRVGKTSRFKVAAKELDAPRTGKPAEDIRAWTEAIYKEFESWIREHPEQWMWSNKRWPDSAMPGGTQD
jgi:Kdo2-lipid IVA lauroyltransferase/acyltransferase